MTDNIDIKEHNALDNSRIKTIYPDITCIKTDVIKYEDEDTNDFDEYSYEDLIPDYLEDVPSLYQNKIIVGSKPCESTSSEEEEPEILGCSVVLEDLGSSLKNNLCFCSDCEILFPTENALESHKMTAHSFLVAAGRNKALKSTTKSSVAARLKFETDSNQKSLRQHSDELLMKNFSCDVCDLVFDSKISLQQHLGSPFSCLLYCCPICFCYFKHTSKIVSHMLDQHQIDVKNVPQPEKPTFKCRFCAKIFRNSQIYNAHMRKVHTEVYNKKITKFECQPNLTFLSADSEKIHRVPQHAIKTYSKSVDLDKQIKIEPLSRKITHRVSQHAIKTYSKSILKHYDELLTKKFSCDDCHLEFESEISYQQHLRSLSGCLLYCCPICSCCFKLTTRIVSHMVDRHQVVIKNEPKREKTTYQCRFCAKTLKGYGAYNAHIRYVHTEQYNKKSTKVECQPCNLTFLSADSEKIHRVSQHAIESETYAKSVDLDKQIKIEPLSPTITHRVSQHEIESETSSKSVDLDKQIKIEPLSPTITHRVSQHEIESETSSKSVDLDKQIKIEPLSPTITHRVSQHEIESETSSKSVDLDKQIKIEPLSPTITHRVSQHEIESETSSKFVDLDKQIKIEPLSPTITHRVSQHEIESETYSKFVDLDKQIKIEPLSPTITHRVSQHEIEAETYSKFVDLDKQIKIESLSPTITHRVSQHEIEAETYSKSVDLDKQIKIESLSPTITHRVSQHEIEAETYSKSVDLDKQIKIEPLSSTIIHRVSQHEIDAETYSKSVDLDKQIKKEPLSLKITQTDLKQEL